MPDRTLSSHLLLASTATETAPSHPTFVPFEIRSARSIFRFPPVATQKPTDTIISNHIPNILSSTSFPPYSQPHHEHPPFPQTPRRPRQHHLSLLPKMARHQRRPRTRRLLRPLLHQCLQLQTSPMSSERVATHTETVPSSFPSFKTPVRMQTSAPPACGAATLRGLRTWLVTRLTAAEAFWSLQDCVRRESKGYLDEYQVQCFPKIEIAKSAGGRDMGVSKVMVGLVVCLGVLVGLA